MKSIKGWQKLASVKGYTFWKRLERGNVVGMVRESELPVYNVTLDGLAPRSTGGYFDVEYLKRIKGVSF